MSHATTSAAAWTWTPARSSTRCERAAPSHEPAPVVRGSRTLERVWDTLIDIERVAPCLPGAEITQSSDDGVYRGSFAVRLGPTTAEYRGRARGRVLVLLRALLDRLRRIFTRRR